MDRVRRATELDNIDRLGVNILAGVAQQYEAMPKRYEWEDFPYELNCEDSVRVTLWAAKDIVFYVTYAISAMADDIEKMDNIEFEWEGQYIDEFDIRFSTIDKYLKDFANQYKNDIEEVIDLDNIPTEEDMLPENEFNPNKHTDIVNIMIKSIITETDYMLNDWYFVRDIPVLEFRTKEDNMDIVLKVVFTPVGVNVKQVAYFGDSQLKLQLSNFLHNQFNGISSIIYNKSYHIG